MANSNIVELTDEQQAYVDTLLSRKSKLVVLRGPAGTGKTFTTAEAIRAASERLSSKDCILVGAPTHTALHTIKGKVDKFDDYGKASKQLRYVTLAALTTDAQEQITVFGKTFLLNDTGINDLAALLTAFKINSTSIIAVFKKRVFEDGQYTTVNKYVIQEVTLRNELSAKGLPIKKGECNVETVFMLRQPESVANYFMQNNISYVMIDESPMVNNETIELLKSAIDHANEEYSNQMGFRTVLSIIGDYAQNDPVSGSPNEYMQLNPPVMNENESMHELTKVLRSSDDIIKLSYAIKGTDSIPGRTVCDLARANFDGITNMLGYDIDRVIDNHLEEIKDADICLAFTHKVVNKLNDTARRLKGFTSSNLQKGESVIAIATTQSALSKNSISNSELFKVIDVVADNNTLIEKFQSYLDYDDMTAAAFDIKPLPEEVKLNILNDFKAYIATNEFILVTIENSMGVKKTAFCHSELRSKHQFSHALKLKTDLATLFTEFIKNINELAPMMPVYAHLNWAFAITIHKSQGSEWDKCFVAYSTRDEYILKEKTRKLEYTGATRARKKETVVAFK